MILKWFRNDAKNPKFLQMLPISHLQGEVKFGVTLEDEMSGEFPPSVLLFRPIRQKVYSILFSTQHREPVRKEGAENGKDFALFYLW